MNRIPFMTVFAVLALCFLSLVYGAVSVHMRWWPSQIVANAGEAFVALMSVSEEEFERDWPVSMESFAENGFAGLTTISHADGDETYADELIFVDGDMHQLRSHCPENGCIAWLMNRNGDIRHVWSIGPELLWSNLQEIDGFSDAKNIYSVGAELLPNGDLLLAYQGRNTYPYGIGLARFDKDSKLLWKKENFAHHWFSVAPDGRIFVPAFNELEAPHRLGGTNLEINCKGGVLQEDVILVLSPDGEELDRISILDVLEQSDYLGIAFQEIHSDRGLPVVWNECDPTHLNDVRLISAEDAAGSEYLAEGDLLVSLRSNNAILVIDPDTRAVKWSSVGRTALQHSPRYMGDNTVLVFDNLGGMEAQGGTRVVRIDMDTDAMDVVYPAPGDDGVTDVLSYTGGSIALDPDRRRALVSLTRQGRTLEIDLESGQLLWEFHNIHDVSGIVDDPEGRSNAYFATQTVSYYHGPDFGFNGGQP